MIVSDSFYTNVSECMNSLTLSIFIKVHLAIIKANQIPSMNNIKHLSLLIDTFMSKCTTIQHVHYCNSQ